MRDLKDGKGQRYARMIDAFPKLLAACQAVLARWEEGDLAEAARMCSEAVETALPSKGRLTKRWKATARPRAGTIRLPCYGMTIRLVRPNTVGKPGSGVIISDLRGSGHTAAARVHNAAIDGLESLILAHTCAGIDVASPAYVEGIETAVEAIANHS